MFVPGSSIEFNGTLLARRDEKVTTPSEHPRTISFSSFASKEPPLYTRLMAARRQRKLIDPGSRAPEFRLARLDRGEATLSSLLVEGPVALAFFKVTCPVCQLTLPFLERIHAAGLRIFGISQNDPEDTREFNQ